MNNTQFNTSAAAVYPLPRMRTAPQAIKELQALDPNTCFTLHALTIMIKQGKIPFVASGRKKLINFDTLLDMLYNSETTQTPPDTINGIRVIKA